jgi:predicted transposase/invertase (TIGR01784 family)
MGYLQEPKHKETEIEYHKTLTKTDLERIIKEVTTTHPEGSEAVMTIAEMLKAEGREEGRGEGKLEVVKNAVREGIEPALIVKLTGLPKKEVEKVAREMAN